MLLICGVVDAVRGSLHSRGHDGYGSVRPSFRCPERLANRHSGLSRGRTCLQIRTDFGMPSAPWLLVCPLLALKEQMQKGARRSERPDETTSLFLGSTVFPKPQCKNLGPVPLDTLPQSASGARCLLAAGVEVEEEGLRLTKRRALAS